MTPKKTKYKKRKGTSGIKGNLYEIKLLNLIFYSACQPHMKEEIEDFYLLTSIEGFEALDDIVLEIKINNEWGAAFVQAKHKEKGSIDAGSLMGDKGDFNLVKYLHSFKNIIEKSDDIYAKENKRFYIIYTTITANRKIKKVKLEDIHLDKIINLISTTKNNNDIFQINANDKLKLKLEDSLQNDIPREEDRRRLVEEFLNKLVIFSNQGSQGKVEEITKEKMGECEQGLNKKRLEKHLIDTLYLNINHKFCQWWLKEGNVEYLTIDCSFLKESRTESIVVPYLNTLNEICRKECTKYALTFTDEAVNKLLNDKYLQIALAKQPKGEITSKSITYVISSNVLLTCMKLIQSLTAYKFYFIDIEFVLSLNEFPVEAMKCVDADLVVVKCDNGEYNRDSSIGQDIERKRIEIITQFPKNVIVVIKQKLLKYLNCDVVNDKNNGLIDLAEECQDKILASKKFIVQGEEVTLGNIITNKNTKILIGEEILLKFVNNEIIEIGRHLKDRNYNDIPCFVQRQIKNKKNGSKCKVKSFKDLKDQTVVVTAEPGMGKSTLVTHLSIKTKKKHPEIWIVRINLLDHSSEFYKWNDEEKKIDLRETIMFVCKAEVEGVEGKLDIQIEADGSAVINHLKPHSVVSKLHLDLIINSYNNGKIIFIFDGFDEICPDYRNEVVNLIKNLVPLRNVWITSRPNNDIVKTLTEQFSMSYKLKALSFSDQKDYYHKYFEDNISINVENTQQLRNINRFLDYLAIFNERNDMRSSNIDSVMQMVVYLRAADYFRLKNIPQILRDIGITTNEHSLSIDHFEHNVMIAVGTNYTNVTGNPMYMLFAANHFVTKIEATGKGSNEIWDINENTLTYLRSFIDVIFGKRWKEKFGRDITKPGESTRYKIEKNEFMQINKKVAFHTLFKDYIELQDFFSKYDISEIYQICTKIENGEENTGLIYSIHNNIPRYHHLVFSEYLASEYIADGIKSGDSEVKKNMFTMFCIAARTKPSVLNFLEKIISQNEELNKLLSDDESQKQMYECMFGCSMYSQLYSLPNVIEGFFSKFPFIYDFLEKSIIRNLDKKFFRFLQMCAREYGSTNIILIFFLKLLRKMNPTTIKSAFSGLSVERLLFLCNSNEMLGIEEITRRIQLESDNMLYSKQYFTKNYNDYFGYKPRYWGENRTILTFMERLTKAKFKKKMKRKINVEVVKKYKRLAFFALFHNNVYFHDIVSASEYSEIKEIVIKIEQEEDDSGLVEQIHHKIPRFTHLYFAQYLACEYISDGIKYSVQHIVNNNMIKLFLFEVIVRDRYGLKLLFERKISYCPKLRQVLSNSEYQKQMYECFFGDDISQTKNAFLILVQLQYEYPLIFQIIKACIINNVDGKFFKHLEIYCDILKVSRLNKNSDLYYCDVSFIIPLLRDLRLLSSTTAKDAVCGFRFEKYLFGHIDSIIMRPSMVYEIASRMRLDFLFSEEVQLKSLDSHICHGHDTHTHSHKIIVSSECTDEDWDLHKISMNFIKNLTETIFKPIWEQKDKNCPGEIVVDVYEKEKWKFIDTCRKLAFVALFHSNVYFSQIVSESEYSEIKEIAKKIEQEKINCDLVDGIHGNIPRFTHLFVAQYFAFEYIAEGMKSDDIVTKKCMINLFLFEVIQWNRCGLRDILKNLLAQNDEFKIILLDDENRKEMYECLFNPNMKDGYRLMFDIFLNRLPKEITIFLLKVWEGHFDKIFFKRLQYFFQSGYFDPNTNIMLCVLDMIRNMKPGELQNALRGLHVEECFINSESKEMLSNPDIFNNLGLYRKHCHNRPYL